MKNFKTKWKYLFMSLLLLIASVATIPFTTALAVEQDTTENTAVTPVQVTGVTAVYQDDSEVISWDKPGYVTLTWDDCGAAFYRVMRVDRRGSYKTLTFRASAEGYVDNSIPQRAQLYYYRVSAYFYNADGTLTEGKASEPVTVLACLQKPGKVTGLGVRNNPQTGIRLYWDEVEGASGYLIERGRGPEWPGYFASGSVQPLKPLCISIHNMPWYNIPISQSAWYRFRVTAYQKLPDGTYLYGEPSECLNVIYKVNVGLVNYAPV